MCNIYIYIYIYIHTYIHIIEIDLRKTEFSKRRVGQNGKQRKEETEKNERLMPKTVARRNDLKRKRPERMGQPS